MKILALVLALALGYAGVAIADCGTSNCYKPEAPQEVQP